MVWSVLLRRSIKWDRVKWEKFTETSRTDAHEGQAKVVFDFTSSEHFGQRNFLIRPMVLYPQLSSEI